MSTADITSADPVAVESAGDPAAWGARHAHDPTVVRDDDGTYYMFSTDSVANSEHIPAGVHIRTSADLVEWTYAGTALDGVPGPAAVWSGAKGLWAPEVVRWPTGEWLMYYSASTFGSNTSAIGLAVAPSPSGPWQDRGLVVATRSGEHSQNAIDAAVTFDADGAPWLTYGSFFSGIYILPLDRTSGLPLVEGDLGTVIARRPKSVEGAVEGAFILRRPEDGRYVLFASYDSLFSSYNVRVAVADAITGPYLDFHGRLMTDLDAPPASVGTKVLGQLPVRRRHGLACPRPQLGPHPGRSGREPGVLYGPPRPVRDRPHRACGAASAFVLQRGWLARSLTPAVRRPGSRNLAVARER